MGLIIFLVIIVIVVMTTISIVMGNFQYRAKQHLLKNTGVSSSDMHAGFSGGLEKKQLEKFLVENPNYTEESIKDLIKQYTMQILSRNTMSEFSEKVCEKMQKDKKLDSIKNMEFKRVNISYYTKGSMSSIVVFTDGKDEYEFNLVCNITENKIQIINYRITKGVVVGLLKIRRKGEKNEK